MSASQLLSKDDDRRVYELLLNGFHASAGQDAEVRWRWLMAAHVVGQHFFRLHWNSHTTMLRFALDSGDYSEAAGQLFRLSLVPVGHLLNRLPEGNVGRATVNAFTPMALTPELDLLIAKERSKTSQVGSYGAI